MNGKGKFLGVNVGINANPLYGNTWWGEGEVKMYLDGDKDFPTLAGTGTEDYIGTAWGQGKFSNRYTGCLIANDSLKQWSFYRFHIPDPVYFNSSCRVTIQQMGGGMKDVLGPMQDAGVPIIPVTVDLEEGLQHLYRKDGNVQISNTNLKGWINYYRSDDISATAYFYLDKPSSSLPVLQPVTIRTYQLK